jgi:hypothetical protein
LYAFIASKEIDIRNDFVLFYDFPPKEIDEILMEETMAAVFGDSRQELVEVREAD